MTLLELILLILFLLALIVVIGAAWYCRGMAAAGSSEIPVNSVIHVYVSATTCRSFSVQFETTNSVTVAYQYQEYAGILVASEDIEPGFGWPYDLILNDLANKPTMTPRNWQQQ